MIFSPGDTVRALSNRALNVTMRKLAKGDTGTVILHGHDVRVRFEADTYWVMPEEIELIQRALDPLKVMKAVLTEMQAWPSAKTMVAADLILCIEQQEKVRGG